MFAYVFNSMLRWKAPEGGMFSSGIQATAMDQLLLMLMKLLSFKATFIREGDIVSYRNTSKEKVGAVKTKASAQIYAVRPHFGTPLGLKQNFVFTWVF